MDKTNRKHGAKNKKNDPEDLLINIEELKRKLKKAEEKIEELNHESHRWWLEAERYRKDYQSVTSSKSWRITWPLRKWMHLIKRFNNKTIQLIYLIVHLQKRMARWVIIRAIDFALKHPALKDQIKGWIHKYPRIDSKLRHLAFAHGLLTVLPRRETTGSKANLKSLEYTVDMDSEDVQLTPAARRIYKELKNALHEKQNEVW